MLYVRSVEQHNPEVLWLLVLWYCALVKFEEVTMWFIPCGIGKTNGYLVVKFAFRLRIKYYYGLILCSWLNLIFSGCNIDVQDW